ncbi:DUF411 domain-containing protein [Novispirillum itersonii]|uniref:DUF411 domain-containing protein n=1 Tax=Novispirillum itersonii TaxID=189 RepID=UPI0003789138|nr:DUF411 domain-containing protein [Novispirillum itersonii]
MRLLPLLPVAGAAVWMGVLAASMVQVPRVAVTAAASCRTEAADWAGQLAGQGFRVETHDMDVASASACLTGQVGGYSLIGAVDPAAVSRLLMTKPRGVTGLHLGADGVVMAALGPAEPVPLQVVLDAEKKR